MDHSYLYSTRIEETFDDDLYEIISFFKHELLRKPKLDIQLINYYKGLPISYPAKLICIEKDTLDIEVYPHQTIVISECHYTFIRYNGLKHDLYANVKYANIKRHTVFLNKLFYVEILAERRSYIRLELEYRSIAVITTKDGIVQGELKEISYNGAGVEINQECSLEINELTTLMFMLHNHAQNLNYNVKTSAQLIKINGESFPKYYRFSTSPDKILDRQIAQFIIQRQIEIIKEIKLATESIDYAPLPKQK